MDYLFQLKEFLGGSVDDGEARQLARSVVAGHVRQLKVAIAQQVWQARRLSGSGDQAGSAEALARGRLLKLDYEDSLNEYDRLAPAGRGPEDVAAPQEDAASRPAGANGRGPLLRLVTPEVAG